MKRSITSVVFKSVLSFALFLTFSVPSFAMPPMPPDDGDNQFAECPDPNEDNMRPEDDNNKPRQFQNKMDAKDCKMKEKFEKMLKKLNITDEQKAKMDALMNSDKAKRSALKKQIQAKRQALDNELLKIDYDTAVIENLKKDIRQLSGDIVQIQIDGKIQIRNIFTHEQFKQIEEDRIKMQKEMKEKMSKMGKMKAQKE